MKLASIVVPLHLQNNRLFNLENRETNRDGCLVPYSLLRDLLRGHEIDLATQDLHPVETSDLVIYSDAPKSGRLPSRAVKILLLFESEVIRPDNWTKNLHDQFDAVFTWNDELLGTKNYHKFNFPNFIPINFEILARVPPEHFCVIIAGNKQSKHALELYSERMRAIQWFEKHRPQDLDLFGMGWDQRTFSGLLRPLNRSQSLRRLFYGRRPSYRGRVAEKHTVLSKYRFSICYENVAKTPGYITEKILDCLFAGCVPVYLGAPNIRDHIPDTCFIDRNSFSSYDALYEYLKQMPEEERLRYVEAGIAFVRSPGMHQFGSEFFAEEITRVAHTLLRSKNGK